MSIEPNNPDRLLVEFEPLECPLGIPPAIRFRQLLKVALRRFHLRARWWPSSAPAAALATAPALADTPDGPRRQRRKLRPIGSVNTAGDGERSDKPELTKLFTPDANKVYDNAPLDCISTADAGKAG